MGVWPIAKGLARRRRRLSISTTFTDFFVFASIKVLSAYRTNEHFVKRAAPSAVPIGMPGIKKTQPLVADDRGVLGGDSERARAGE